MDYPKTYRFPAVFEYGNEEIGVYFPDLPGCITGGETEEAFHSAQEAMGLHLFGMEQDGEEIPKASLLKDVSLEGNERAVWIEVYMPSFDSLM